MARAIVYFGVALSNDFSESSLYLRLYPHEILLVNHVEKYLN